MFYLAIYYWQVQNTVRISSNDRVMQPVKQTRFVKPETALNAFERRAR